MKKLLLILAAASVVAGTSVYAVDQYQKHYSETEQTTVQQVTTEPATTAEPETEPETKEIIEYEDVSAQVEKPFNKKLVADSAILVDVDSKSILYSKNAQKKLAPASTTKLVTALVALEHLNPNKKVKVGEEITLIGEGSSVAQLEQGDVLKVRKVVEGLLISSGNDAAYVLAVNTARSIKGKNYPTKKAVKYFVKLMNKKVKELGISNTRFTTPDGYDAKNQYSTAYDLSVIAYEALQNDVIMKSVSVHSKYVKEIDATWTSTDELMNPQSQYYYKYAIGLKTGSTGTAGKCFVGAAEKNGKKVISVVLNSDEAGRWTDSKALLKYGLSKALRNEV